MTNPQEYKFVVFCPDDEEMIEQIIAAASSAGAGTTGNYTECSFVSRGVGTWRAGEGADPAIGRIGALEHVAEVRIEMRCTADYLAAVGKAVRAVHPYEEPYIEAVPLTTL